ncbi:MAG: ABC transporter ATP-binding protein [Clostridiales bacterium]|nr:ABC transporter ATP-binding protein [Clostridiales bacterium]
MSTQARRDLARELQDPEYRRQYLHPRKMPFLKVLWRMYAPVRSSARMVLAHIAYAFCDGVLPLLSVLILYVLVGLLGAPKVSPRTMLMAAGVYGLVYFLCSALSVQLKERNYTWFTRQRLLWLNRTGHKIMEMDFGLYENPAFMDDIKTAHWSFSGNNAGLEGTWHKVFEMGGTLVSALLLGGLLFWLSPLVAAAGLVLVAITVVAQAHISSYRHKRREELVRLMRRMGMLREEAANFKAGKDLRLYRMAGRFQQVFDPLLTSYMKLYRAFTRREFSLSFLEGLALVAVDLVCALLLVHRRMAGAITMADFVMLLSAVILFSQTLVLLSQQLGFIKNETLYVQDAFDFLDVPLTSLDGQGQVPGEGPVSIRFENVSFAYPGTDRLVLEGLSFDIAPGERCALVGLNGAGKTTLAKLLLGLYQPNEGKIYINEVDSATLPQKALFALFGTVFQEVDPLAFTIAETVAAREDGIDRARVTEALQTAGLWDKVNSFEKGIDTPLLKIIHEEGVILSGGENQKLMIARALYRKDARMMVMDEPTAALDALAEQAIYQQFDDLLKGRTALFISHRLASTYFCDRILLLSGGQIAQHGSHQELLAQEGLYRQLFHTQGKYYQDIKKEVPREQ